jgi:hypothetical protein
MSRSFVVGGLNDCCAASKGLADGLSFSQWSRARADLHQNRPRHAGRCKQKSDIESEGRRHIGAYIRNLLDGEEGSKGGSRKGGKRFIPRDSKRARWKDYSKSRTRLRLPIYGSERLFGTVWDEQTNIVEISTTGHSICDTCTKIQVRKDKYGDRKDAHAAEESKITDIEEEVHKGEHRGERAYGDDLRALAERRPDRATFLNMDAPTKDQLEIPVQPRQTRDVAKSLEHAPGWASKMMGVMMAGIGMLCFLTHTRLGGGPNLSCTCVFLTLLYMVENDHTLGSRLELLLDNTNAENKCNEVIFFLAWVVAQDYFDDAGFFCMLKGHTYTELDQTFNTMIMYLKQFPIYCVSTLLRHIWKALRKYDCLKVIELHAIWDWKEYFKPHINDRIGGFTTGQFGSGMHEFYLRKDQAGIVRI